MKPLALCLLAVMLLLPSSADATNVDDSLVVGIQATKTTSIRPLEPLERDFMSVYDLMYDGLMVINDNYIPECALAESYSHTGKTWTFKLRNDLKFSDGSAVTADDVVATANWIINKVKTADAAEKEAKAKNIQNFVADRGYYMNLKYFVSSITARDPQTVVIKADRNY